MSCGICIEDYNQTTRKEVKCPYCDYSGCSSCMRQYLLNATNDAHCMNCRRAWNREILVEKFPMSFLTKDYKQHREQVLYEREKSMLPDTQAKAQKYRLLRNLENTYADMLSQLQNLMREQQKLRKDMDDNKRMQSIYRNRNADNLFRTAKKNYLRGCPVGDCRGFINEEWQCGVCEVYICNKCHEPIGKTKENKEHVCDPDNRESAKLIMSQTKPCPKCAAPISKIEGCDQMWCTMCHTAFSWRTGEIETRRIHNPHYYQWHRDHGGLQRELADDVQCGGIPALPVLREWLGITHIMVRQIQLHIYNPTRYPTSGLPSNISREDYNEIYVAHNLIQHMEIVELPRYRRPENMNEMNEDLRIMFLNNELTEDDFKVALQQREKRILKKEGIYMIIQMFVTVSGDIMRNHLSTPYKDGAIRSLLNELHTVREYANTQYLVVKKQYNNCRVINITKQWQQDSI